MSAKGVAKTILTLAGIVGIMAAGDYFNINENIEKTAAKIFPAIYRNVEVENGFYSKPHELDLVIEKNEYGRIEEYLTTKEKRYVIYQGTKDIIVGNIEDIADNLTESQKEQLFTKFSKEEQNKIMGDYLKRKAGDAVEDGKDFLKEIYEKIKEYFEKP